MTGREPIAVNRATGLREVALIGMSASVRVARGTILCKMVATSTLS